MVFYFFSQRFQKPIILAFRDIWIIQPKPLGLQLREQDPKKSGDRLSDGQKGPKLAFLGSHLLAVGPTDVKGERLWLVQRLLHSRSIFTSNRNGALNSNYIP